MTERIIRIAELATRLDKSPRTIYRLLKKPPRGFPPKIKIGASTGFREQDLNEFIRQIAESARAEAAAGRAAA